MNYYGRSIWLTVLLTRKLVHVRGVESRYVFIYGEQNVVYYSYNIRWMRRGSIAWGERLTPPPPDRLTGTKL